VCLRAECPPGGQQPRLAIIFRGTGKRITAVEKASWHPSIDVYFQPKAWLDRDTALAWAKKTFKNHVDADYKLRGLVPQPKLPKLSITPKISEREKVEEVEGPEENEETSESDSENEDMIGPDDNGEVSKKFKIKYWPA